MAVYAIPATGSISAARDVVYCYVGNTNNRVLRFRGLLIGNTSEVGEAAEEALEFQVIKETAAGFGPGTGGVVVTPAVINDLDPAIGAVMVARAFETANSTFGSALTTLQFSWNIRHSPAFIFPPEPGLEITSTSAGITKAVLVRLISTPADAISLAVTLFVEVL